MIQSLYAIKDRLRGYVDVKLIGSDAEAMRDFKFMCSESTPYIYFNREDWSIYKLGDFDTVTGDLIVREPEVIMKGADILASEKDRKKVN